MGRRTGTCPASAWPRGGSPSRRPTPEDKASSRLPPDTPGSARTSDALARSAVPAPPVWLLAEVVVSSRPPSGLGSIAPRGYSTPAAPHRPALAVPLPRDRRVTLRPRRLPDGIRSRARGGSIRDSASHVRQGDLDSHGATRGTTLYRESGQAVGDRKTAARVDHVSRATGRPYGGQPSGAFPALSAAPALPCPALPRPALPFGVPRRVPAPRDAARCAYLSVRTALSHRPRAQARPPLIGCRKFHGTAGWFPRGSYRVTADGHPISVHLGLTQHDRRNTAWPAAR